MQPSSQGKEKKDFLLFSGLFLFSLLKKGDRAKNASPNISFPRKLWSRCFSLSLSLSLSFSLSLSPHIYLLLFPHTWAGERYSLLALLLPTALTIEGGKSTWRKEGREKLKLCFPNSANLNNAGPISKQRAMCTHSLRTAGAGLRKHFSLSLLYFGASKGKLKLQDQQSSHPGVCRAQGIECIISCTLVQHM